ncbi:uncharacterized protein THITE_2154193 [Thermothielavioides terrestris NRRL 8126]|uniref:HMG box domain-containing protein n=1 Tax=Thermothielavioides terrestris (strain ATCC 38088 / NRRL 8126) TaxID=578455 RepID=G2R1Y1_THETT|nr:uncharacterized protein THITE_2154193 [Thermothielavioides terrestris NRRL 8126]AEO65762.1 hypothetical protein THITE_2154193 [Thermothielavioides terrestris NRRL 8126]
MSHNTPPSPAPTSAEPLPSGFSELLQHNEAASHPPNAMPAESVHAHSQPDNSPYGPIPEPYSTPATSPPTPSRGSDVVATRSATRSGNARGEIVAKVLGPRSTRIEKPTPKRKKERAKPPKNMPVLDKPMSELTKNSSIPVADIDAYVRRSSEVRRQEVETGKNPGRVKRPMNAFMLYRKAYQQRAKEWASQHNHQIVSRVCGMSWPLEPEHIRQQFKLWADIERDNHQKAHPNYKFTPAKPHKPPSKFEGGGFDDHSDGSDLDDYDWAGQGSSRMRSATHTPGADSDYIPSRAVYAATHSQPHQVAGMHAIGMMHPHHTRSAAFDFNPVKPMPAAYDHRDLPGQYYEAHVRNPQQRLHHGAVEDALMHRTPSPSLAFPQVNVGLPSHYELNQYNHKVEHSPEPQFQPQQQQQQHHHHAQHLDHRIDPSLLPQDEALFGTGNFNTVPSIFDSGLAAPQHTWQAAHLPAGTETESQFPHASFLGLDETLSLEQHAQFLKGADEWQIEPLPETAHFDTSWVEPKAEP